MPQTLTPGPELPASSQGRAVGLEHGTDERLVVLARSGDERAFDEIMRRYRGQLHAYCSQLLGPSRAEDAVQQAFLQALVALRRGSDRPIVLRPWLYRISRNCSIDILRRKGWDYEQLDPEYDGVAQPPRLVEQKQEIEKLVLMLRGLPERQRRALTLRELEGRSYNEIATELGHSSAGVRQLIFRARSALRSAAAAVALPIAFLRARVANHATSLADAHQAAFVSSAGADPAGLGLAKAGAVLIAGLTVLTGGATTGQHRPDRRPAASPSVTAARQTGDSPAAARASSESARPPRAKRKRPGTSAHHSVAAQAAAPQAPVPAVVEVAAAPAASPPAAVSEEQAQPAEQTTASSVPSTPKPRAPRHAAGRQIHASPDNGSAAESDPIEVSPPKQSQAPKRVPKRPPAHVPNLSVSTRGSDSGQKTQKANGQTPDKVQDSSKTSGQARLPAVARR